MGYLVLARKYRPQTFSDVVSQEHVVTTLTNALQSKRVAHAILFSGPRGTGKTTIARILAKAMNCETGPTATPCNQCRSCREITAGNAADVFEIDGASNNGVDQIRELRDNIKYLPAHSPYKIYIIDEVHMLSIQAFNALLKTLEEPPPHILFFFATTEAKKIPITIQSRCQRHELKRIDFKSIKAHLKYICEQEQAAIDEEALNIVTGAGAGSMRDALSILDHVVACAEGHITGAQVIEVLGLIDRRKLFDISGAILAGSAAEALSRLDEIYHLGYDMKDLLGDLIHHFRNLLMVKIGQHLDKLVDLPEHEISLMKQQVQSASEIQINRILDALFKEEPLVKLSNFPKPALEMVIIRLLQVKPVLPMDALIEKIDQLRIAFHTQPVAYAASTLTSASQSAQIAEPTADPSAPLPEQSTADAPLSMPVLSIDDPSRFWNALLESIPKTSSALRPILEKCELMELTDSQLDLKISGTKFELERLEKKKSVIADVCRQLLNKELKINLITIGGKTEDLKQKRDKADQIRSDALSHPLVDKTVALFKGRVVDVKSLS